MTEQRATAAATTPMINIAGLDKMKVLRALWENAKPAGVFHGRTIAPPKFDEAEARRLLEGKFGMDYVCGRPIKMNLYHDEINPRAYDADATQTAASVIALLRADKPTPKTVVGDLSKLPQGKIEVVSLTDSDLAAAMVSSTTDVKSGDDGKRIKDIAVQKFDSVWFTEAYVKVIESAGIAYPAEWHMFLGMADDDKSARFAGSMGGAFLVPLDAPVVKKWNSGF